MTGKSDRTAKSDLGKLRGLFPVLLGGGSLVVSVIALGISVSSRNLSEEANKISQQALDYEQADQEYSAVMMISSLQSFKTPLKLCNTVNFELRNYSQKSQTISPQLRSTGLCVHEVKGLCPNTCSNQLRLKPFVLGSNGTYQWSFKLHTRRDNPVIGTLDLSAGANRIWRIMYRRNENNGTYYYQE